ncbi:MAG: argininosuccinate lyase [Spirochaetales bacterium]|nr:argininosuccinate lyase [Spirochaetales bacterium]
MSKKAWAGRFTESNAPLFEKMNQSLGFDIKMFKEDIALNTAYSKELNRIGILSAKDYQAIAAGLAELEKEIEEKGIAIFPEDTEDIHMGIESLLAEKIGDVAKKIHAGKSRNDQVATDVRLYVYNQVKTVIAELCELLASLLKLAEDNQDAVMPGFTHLRQAQPVLFSHYIMSFFFSMSRDVERFSGSLDRISTLPLGSAALAGSAYPINRENLRKDLDFVRISCNSMDGVLSRDFLLETLSNISILSITLSRLAEDFILFSSEQYGFFELSDKVTTGSSIMPNKKNPDSLELTRGKTGRVIGNMTGLFVTLKGLPSTYNKDLQEDKEAVFDSLETIIDLLQVTTILIDSMKINKERMSSSIDSLSFATELADYLAKSGLPFREAHHIVGRIVLEMVNQKKDLTSLSESDLLEYSEHFKGIGDDWGDIEKFLSKRELPGGTGRNALKQELKEATLFLEHWS